jgi:hypothetical protein
MRHLRLAMQLRVPFATLARWCQQDARREAQPAADTEVLAPRTPAFASVAPLRPVPVSTVVDAQAVASVRTEPALRLRSPGG